MIKLFEEFINESKSITIKLKSKGKDLDFKTQRKAYDELSQKAIIVIDDEEDKNFYNDIDYINGLKLYSIKSFNSIK